MGNKCREHKSFCLFLEGSLKLGLGLRYKSLVKKKRWVLWIYFLDKSKVSSCSELAFEKSWPAEGEGERGDKQDTWERVVPLLQPTETPEAADSNSWTDLKPALVHIFSSEIVMLLLWKTPVTATAPLCSSTDVSGSAGVNQFPLLFCNSLKLKACCFGFCFRSSPGTEPPRLWMWKGMPWELASLTTWMKKTRRRESRS